MVEERKRNKLPKPDYLFKTDGCSGGMTWLWTKWAKENPPWNDCCVRHDNLYWRGGTKEDRRKADRNLLIDVTMNGHPVFAILMYLAVRVGGHPLLPLSWRWGYGWKYPRGYQKEGF